MTDKSHDNSTSSDYDCLFCRIINGDSPAKIIYQDDQCLAFWDIHPKAPIHILIIPIKHISSVNQMCEEDEEIIGHLVLTAAKIAAQLGIEQNGYRLIINTGRGAGQSIFHIHMHLLSGSHLAGFE